MRQYIIVFTELERFSALKNFPLRIRECNKLTAREKKSERVYWKRFYRAYTDYLFSLGCFDNYAGLHIKIIRTFLYYVKAELGINAGDFSHYFYVRNENIPIIALTKEQLYFLIHDTEFENSLPLHLQRAKDTFVFGCTVGLRFSDIMSLTKKNLERNGASFYIRVRSIKTSTDTRIKLPEYAVALLRRHAGGKTLLPVVSVSRLNYTIKELCERAGWTHEIEKIRERRGVQKKITINGKSFRFCDLVTTHTMRRTAITTLLNMGMPETLVRKISGHAANSKEFYKYVSYAQPFIDEALDRVYNQMDKKPENNLPETNL